MKKRLFLFILMIITRFGLNGQSILLEPGKQGINSNNAPNGTFEMSGNGMLLHDDRGGAGEL